MQKREKDKTPWPPSTYFTNGGVLIAFGLLLINGGDAAPIGVIVAFVGGVQVLVGAIRKGVTPVRQDQPD